MSLALAKQWDIDTRQDVDYNAGTTTTDSYDTNIWDDEPAPRLAAERYEAIVSATFDKPTTTRSESASGWQL